MSHWSVQGLWLLHHQYWALTEPPLGYPVVALCNGDPAALDLQVRFIHMLQQFIYEVAFGVEQLRALVLCLDIR